MLRSSILALIAGVAICLLLSCCATSSEVRAKQALFQRTIPTCDGEKDCNAKWEAAQLWIVHNSGYKLQTVTNVLLETYNPGRHDTKLAVRVTKEPLGGGKYMIIVTTWCNNMFGCTRNTWDAALDFNVKVDAARP